MTASRAASIPVAMRIALVSPYSWTYPGGVTRHIEALAEQLLAEGHHVRVLAPFDPPDRRSERLHRGARPQERALPEYVIPLGRTVGIPANGAVSNLALTPSGVQTPAPRARGRRLRRRQHPRAGRARRGLGRAGLRRRRRSSGPSTRYGTNAVTHGIARAMGAGRRMRNLHGRIAVSEAAAWTARRFFGGRYDIVPNGVDVPERLAPRTRRASAGRLRIAFVGQAVERKGLPVLLRAFEGLREHVDAELTIVGAVPEEVEPLLLDARGVTVLGRVDDEEKSRVLREADVLCAPSLGGESFGMVLTEAFAQGTPVVASDIAGYRDVVRDGRDGVLVPRGDAIALAETLRGARARARAPARAMGAAAAEHARALRLAAGRRRGPRRLRAGDRRARPRAGERSADDARASRPASGAHGARRAPPARAAAPGLARARARRRARAGARRRCAAALVAARRRRRHRAHARRAARIGVDRIAESLLRSSPSWVLAALGADVRVDGAARDRVARDPARRAARPRR